MLFYFFKGIKLDELFIVKHTATLKMPKCQNIFKGIKLDELFIAAAEMGLPLYT